MGVGTGVGKAARCVGVGVLVAAMAACSTSSGVSKDVTLAQALTDYRNGNTTLAKKEFLQVVKTDPSNKYGWYNLGVIAQFGNDSGTASADYLKAIGIDANFESALYNYGLLLAQTKNASVAVRTEATTYLRRAAEANPNDANALWNLGLELATLHTPAANVESKTWLNKAIKLDPTLLSNLASQATVSGGSGTAGGTGGTGSGGVTTSTVKPKGAAVTTSSGATAP